MTDRNAAASAAWNSLVPTLARAIFLCALAIFALAQAPAAEAGTWLDQRFYDSPPQNAGKGGWKSRSAYSGSEAQPRTTTKRRRAASGGERKYGNAKSQKPRNARSGSGQKYASRNSQRRRIVLSEGERDHSSRTKKRGVKVASLGNDVYDVSPSKRSVAGGVSWVASAGCLSSTLRSVIYQVAANYGPVRVNSTCRSRRHNARVGGAHRSHHLTGNAVDFRVRGNVGATLAFLKSNGSVGGLKHYGGGLFHIDTGARRTW